MKNLASVEILRDVHLVNCFGVIYFFVFVSDVPESYFSRHRPFELDSPKIFSSCIRVESSLGRVTKIVESLQVNGLQAVVKVESCFFNTNWCPTNYKPGRVTKWRETS